MRLHGIVFLFLLLALLGCSRQKETTIKEGGFNPETGVYDMPEASLSYKVYNPETSIVAPPADLPEQLEMCVVDTVANVSTLLLNLKFAPVGEEQARQTVDLISLQDKPKDVVVVDRFITQCNFLDSCAWNFKVLMDIKTDAESVPVTYFGYIFGARAFVVTAMGDSVSNDFFKPYVVGLKVVDNE